MKLFLEILQEYLLIKDTDYCILLTGKWGSGKTYFVRNKIQKKISRFKNIKGKPYKALYVSLNGLTKIEDISQKIFLSFLTINEENIGLDLSRAIFEMSDIIDYGKDIKSIFSALFNFSKRALIKNFNPLDYLIIFDDLERVGSGIKIKDVLGYINNNFLTRSNKVLIICDESEIDKNKEINENYGIVKEKTIKRTIEYNFKISNFIPDYLKVKFQDDFSYYKYLESKFIVISEILERASLKNIRTYNFIFDSFKKIYYTLKQEYHSDFLDSILQFTILISIQYKTVELLTEQDRQNYHGLDELESIVNSVRFEDYFEKKLLKKEQEKEQKEKPKIDLEDFYKKYIEASNIQYVFYKSVYRYILSGYLNEESFNLEVAELVASNREMPWKTAYNKMIKLWYLELEDLINTFQVVLEYAKEGKYQLVLFPNIYRFFHLISKNEIVKSDFGDVFKTLMQAIDNLKEDENLIPTDLDYLNLSYSKSSEDDKKFEMIMHKIKTIIIKRKNNLENQKRQKFLNSLKIESNTEYNKNYFDLRDSNLIELIYQNNFHKELLLSKNFTISRVLELLRNRFPSNFSPSIYDKSELNYINKIIIELEKDIKENKVKADPWKLYLLNKLLTEMKRICNSQVQKT